MRMSLRGAAADPVGAYAGSGFDMFCRDGEQGGSRKRHNPINQGQPSHHPLVAWPLTLMTINCGIRYDSGENTGQIMCCCTEELDLLAQTPGFS